MWIGTPKGRDSFWKLWKDALERGDWFTLFLPASQSGLLPQAELDDSLRQMIAIQGDVRGRAAYAQEFECSFDAPTPGAIYGAHITKARAQGRISDTVLHYAQLPVYSVFDIGAPANTKCWIFQAVGDRIQFLECLTGDDECATPAAWVKRLKDKVRYNWGSHFLPHDGETMWLRAMQEAGMSGCVVLPRNINEWDNINTAIGALPQCWFNSVGCADGLDALEAYRAKEEADGMSIRNVPVHDWASHASTAFGYAHQAIKLGMLVDRSAMPRSPMRPGGVKIAPRRVHAGYGGRY